MLKIKVNRKNKSEVEYSVAAEDRRRQAISKLIKKIICCGDSDRGWREAAVSRRSFKEQKTVSKKGVEVSDL